MTISLTKKGILMRSTFCGRDIVNVGREITRRAWVYFRVTLAAKGQQGDVKGESLSRETEVNADAPPAMLLKANLRRRGEE